MHKNENINNVIMIAETEKYFGIPFGAHSYYLVHVPTGRSQHKNEVEITQEEYETLLRANQETGAEIRLCRDGKLKAFIEYTPSDKHTWNPDQECFEISHDDLNEQKEAKNTAFLSSETRRTNDAIEVLDDAIEFEEATTEEIARHKSLRKYRLDLSRVQNQEMWPLNPIWPECPDFFKQ